MNVWAHLFLSVSAFILVFLLRFPFYGEDSGSDGRDFNFFNQEIPLDNGAAALISAIIAGLAVWVLTGFFKATR